MVHSIDGLVEQMNDYKVSSDDIIPIKFIMKDEIGLYSDDKDIKEKVKNCQFISIIRGKPHTEIKRQTCIGKDSKGAIITATKETFMYNNPFMYKYDETTLKIVTDWLYTDKLINQINNQLIKLEIEDLEYFIKFLNNNKDYKNINLKDTIQYKRKD